MSYSVLVVDDDPTTVEMLSMVLSLEGYEVTGVDRGPLALEHIGRRQPDVVVLDVMMPGMSGLEALRRLRTDPRIADTKVLVLSARARDVDVWSGWMAGADAYVTKPMDVAVLVAEIRRLTGELEGTCAQP